MVVRAYFDDSGDDKRKRFCVVGGLIGNPSQWSVFEDRWGICTSAIPGPFHAADCDCNPPRGVFAGWPKQQCNVLMATLVRVIAQCRLMGFASIVPVAEYREVFPGAKEFDPYFLAVRHAIINMGIIGQQIAPAFGAEGIDVFFENSQKLHREHKEFDDIRDVSSWQASKYLRNFHPADKEVMAVQGADLVAREAFKHADNRGVRATRRPVRELKHRMSFHMWDRTCLEYLRDHGGPDDLTTMTEWGYKLPPEVPAMKFYYKDGFEDNNGVVK
jgi:hypothetical protein